MQLLSNTLYSLQHDSRQNEMHPQKTASPCRLSFAAQSQKKSGYHPQSYANEVDASAEGERQLEGCGMLAVVLFALIAGFLLVTCEMGRRGFADTNQPVGNVAPDN